MQPKYGFVVTTAHLAPYFGALRVTHIDQMYWLNTLIMTAVVIAGFTQLANVTDGHRTNVTLALP